MKYGWRDTYKNTLWEMFDIWQRTYANLHAPELHRKLALGFLRKYGLALLVCAAIIGTPRARAQQVTASNVTTPKVTVKTTPEIPQVTQAYVQTSQGGTNNYWYWIVSRDASGNYSAPAGPWPAANVAVPSASAPIVISWTSAGSGYTYDLLRTTTASSPSGTASIAVATGLSAAYYSDTVTSPASYTVSTQAAPCVMTASGIPTSITSNCTIGGPSASDGIQFVSPDGNASNDGLSWGTAVWGTDVGAALNTAYANLPATGGTIYVASTGGAGATHALFSTPIVFGTSGKTVSVIGVGENATVLEWTPLTGTAMTVSAVGSSNNSNGKFEGFSLIAQTDTSSQASIGLSITAEGVGKTIWSRVYINGFQTNWSDGGYDTELINSGSFYCSAASGSIGFVTTSTADDTHITNGEFEACNTLISNGNSNPIWDSGTVLAGGFAGENAPTNTWVANGTGLFSCVECHWYNNGATTALWFTNGGGSVIVQNSRFEDGESTGSSTSYATQSGGSTLLLGDLLYSNGHTVSEFVDVSGGGISSTLLDNVSPTEIPALYSGDLAGAFATSIVSTGNPNNYVSGDATKIATGGPQVELEDAGGPPALSGANGVSSGTIVLVSGSGSHTFTTAYSSAPVCVATDQTAPNSTTANATTTTVSVTGTGTDHISWICTPAIN